MKISGWRIAELTLVAAIGIPLVNVLSQAESQQPWQELPKLPPNPTGGGTVFIGGEGGGWPQPGLAGPFVGVSNGALIVGGGANFPDKMPWHGGTKAWHNQVFVLDGEGVESAKWHYQKGWWLPRPLAYGVSIETADGVICIGGCDAERCYPDVFRLTWSAEEKKFSTLELAPMPGPLAFMAGTIIGDTIYVVGGQDRTSDASSSAGFRSYDVKTNQWTDLADFPGTSRVLPLVAAANDGVETCLYVISGREIGTGKTTQMLSDTWKYQPSSKQWRKMAPVSADDGVSERCVMAGTCLATGGDEITVFGGADGKLYLELEALGALAAGDGADAERAGKKSMQILENHPGFSRDILKYDAVNDRWQKNGELPEGSQVTTTAVSWQRAVVIPSGEVRPGVRTAKTWMRK